MYQTKRKLKLLLLTSGCDGTDVGEAWSAFQWVSRLAARHDVTLLTYRKRNRESAVGQLPEARVIEWLDVPIVGRWDRFNSMLKPGYVAFYLGARRWIKRRLAEGESFDLAHQISPLALRYPSPAAALGLPLVIGPLGGSLNTPAAFLGEFGSSPWYTKLRNFDNWRLRHDPWLRSSFRSADMLVGVGPYVRDLLGDLVRRGFALMSETGISELPPTRRPHWTSTRPLRLLFVGRVIRSKGVRDAIRALAKTRDLGAIRLDIIGDGDDMPACKKEAQELGLEDRVIFHGRLSRKDVDPFYEQAHIFIFPSFREPSGNAVIEAMSYGLPVIVADRGGPGFVAEEGCGIRVPVIEPIQFATDIAAAIRKLAADLGARMSIGLAAREKMRRDFLWNAKVDRLMRLYEELLCGVEKPLFSAL